MSVDTDPWATMQRMLAEAQAQGKEKPGTLAAFVRGHDGLLRPGVEADVSDCTSNECQIRKMCTSPTACRRPSTWPVATTSVNAVPGEYPLEPMAQTTAEWRTRVLECAAADPGLGAPSTEHPCCRGLGGHEEWCDSRGEPFDPSRKPWPPGVVLNGCDDTGRAYYSIATPDGHRRIEPGDPVRISDHEGMFCAHGMRCCSCEKGVCPGCAAQEPFVEVHGLEEWLRTGEGDPLKVVRDVSDQSRAARKPPPPEELVGALQDTAHQKRGPGRPARSVKVARHVSDPPALTEDVKRLAEEGRAASEEYMARTRGMSSMTHTDAFYVVVRQRDAALEQVANLEARIRTLTERDAAAEAQAKGYRERINDLCGAVDEHLPEDASPNSTWLTRIAAAAERIRTLTEERDAGAAELILERQQAKHWRTLTQQWSGAYDAARPPVIALAEKLRVPTTGDMVDVLFRVQFAVVELQGERDHLKRSRDSYRARVRKGKR